MTDRLAILRSTLSKQDKIIEIGPCHNPVAPKRDGWNTYSLDHTDRQGLLSKYKHDPTVDPALIEPVDFVWRGGELCDAVGAEHWGTFDAFIASHVIEHTPDLVAFLRSAEKLLAAGGQVILAVPDKRVCFDFYRPISTIGAVIEAYHEKRIRHARRTLWDSFSHLAVKGGAPGWGRENQDQLELIYNFGDAAGFAAKADEPEYVDAHSWVFVPASFELILLKLARLGLLDLKLERSEPAPGTEFYAWLKRGGQAVVCDLTEQEFMAKRRELLDTVMLQLDEQAQQLPGSSADRSQRRVAELEESRNELASALEPEMASLRRDLDEARELLIAMRSTRAWQSRTRLRRLLRLPPTVADRQIG